MTITEIKNGFTVNGYSHPEYQVYCETLEEALNKVREYYTPKYKEPYTSPTYPSEQEAVLDQVKVYKKEE